MRLRALLLGATAAIALPGLAAAQGTDRLILPGPYVGIAGGYSWTEETETEFQGTLNDVDFTDGLTGVVEGGYRMANGLRAGLELGWSRNTVGDIVGGPIGRGGGEGDVDLFTVMGTAYYELNAIGAFRPYVGAGVGIARVRFNGVGHMFAPGRFIDATDNAVAWQAAAGAAYALSPNLDLTLGYRYLDTGLVKLDQGGGTDPIEFDLQSHAVLIGIRYAFGAAPAPRAAEPVQAAAPPPPPPPPPPAPPPAPEVARNYQIFFDFDRADLTDDARRVLDNVARAVESGAAAAIAVTGHADTSGPDDYNERLSLRRAESVRAHLLALGLPASAIAIDARGETELLVPTPDGVREPSNRRAVVILP